MPGHPKNTPAVMAPTLLDPNSPLFSKVTRDTRPREARPSVRAFATADPTPVGAPRPAGTVLMW